MAATEQPKIFKKVIVVEGGGHHGGGWKVAYADFMTAMMAFFLLMWILASSDEQKLRGIAEYFTEATMPGGSGVLDGATLGPPGTLSASNGAIVARGAELGKVDNPSPAKWEIRDTTATPDPNEIVKGTNEGDFENPASGNTTDNFAQNDQNAMTGGQLGEADHDSDGTKAMQAEDDQKFEELQAKITQAMSENPDLDPLKENIIFEKTPEGLQILIIDQKGKPMFRSGKADMVKAADQLMAKLGGSLAALPNRMIISGHTDAVPFADSSKYDNWDLSADRANATRRVFETSGVTRERIIRVSGMADTKLLKPEDPKAPANRRISVLVQYRDKTMNKPMAKDMPATDHADMSKGHGKMDKPMAKGSDDKMSKMAAKTNDHAPKMASNDPMPKPMKLEDKVFQDLRSALR